MNATRSAVRALLRIGAAPVIRWAWRCGTSTCDGSRFAGLDYVYPTEEAGRATIATAGPDIPTDLPAYPADPQGAGSYRIITSTWMLLHENYPNPRKGSALKEFVGRGLTEGQGTAVRLGYSPLPAASTHHAQTLLAGIR